MSEKNSEQPRSVDSRVPKRIVILVDGTGNSDADAKEMGNDVTNVIRLRDCLVKDEFQSIHYLTGVGTSENFVYDAKAGITGMGAEEKKDEALRFLQKTRTAHSSVYLFGFSRGAAICRDLANAIVQRMPETKIEMIGLWDTVAAFGIPLKFGRIDFDEINIGKELVIPRSVGRTVHLLSIDETRKPFEPTLIDARDDVEEVWFAGSHADVGGGFEQRELADITLRYMIRRAKQAGLRFVDAFVDAIPVNDDGHGGINGNNWKAFFGPRKITVHENGSPSTKHPRIHRTVQKRLMAGGYAPKNLLDLNGKFTVVD